MDLTFFVHKYIGKKVDFDGAYGAQCVDLFRQYTKEVLEVPEHTGPVEGAKDLWRNYLSLAKEKQYFSRVPVQTPAEPGYVAVWDGTKTNKYGHVAIVLADCGKDLLVLEQNGVTQKGAELIYRSKLNLLGYLVRR